MSTSFKCVSLTYKNVPLKIREPFSFDEHACKTIMKSIQEISDASDLLMLSTCNRTEIYYSSSKDYSKEIILLLGLYKGITSVNEYYSYFHIINDHEEAMRHLFEVSIGLDSQVIGDAQISNQVKQAYQWSADTAVAGPFLHRLLHTIFFTHKKVVQTTAFKDGAASVSYATVELAESLCSNIENPNILIVGLGEIGVDVCRHLIKSSFKNIIITNRTLSKAEEFKTSSAVRIIPFENLWNAIQQADVIISSVSMAKPLITKEQVNALTIDSYKYFIDLSVPRSIESTIEENPALLLYNVDHIQNKTTAALEKRMHAIPLVKEIIEESIVELSEWSKNMEVSPVINKLKEALEQIRKQELSRHLKNLTSNESEKIEQITRSMMQKIIKLPVLQLKAACKRGESDILIDVLNELFDLQENIKKK